MRVANRNVVVVFQVVVLAAWQRCHRRQFVDQSPKNVRQLARDISVESGRVGLDVNVEATSNQRRSFVHISHQKLLC